MRNEQYGDMLRRLFPEQHHDCKMCVGGNFTRNITMQVTEACNLRCTYCYQHAKTPLTMSWDTAKKFIDLILASDERMAPYIRSRECPGVILDFIGGEPFLAIDLISDICDYFIEQMIALDHPWLNRYRFSFSTNGTLYFDDRVQKFLNKHRAHTSMSVTIDGTRAMHDMCRVDEFGNGSYDLAAKAAADWKNKTGVGQGTKITISPDNLSMLSDAILEFVQQGVKIINANCVFEDVWTVDHAKELYRHLVRVADYMLDHNIQNDYHISILDRLCGDKYESEHPWCGGSGLMLCVDPKGDFYPCIRYAPSSVGDSPKYILGDVDHGITDMDKVYELSKVTRLKQVQGTTCETCPISQGCADCAGYSYEVFGEVGKRTTFICDMHIARVLAQIYYRNKSKKRPLAMNVPKEWAIPIVGEEEYLRLEGIANANQGKRLYNAQGQNQG